MIKNCEKIKYQLLVLRYRIEVIFTNIQMFFGFRKSIEPIPDNTPYCYIWDEERNKKEPTNGYWIKPCKYYRGMKGHNAACTYLGIIGFDPLLGDQCKVCGIKDWDGND